MTSQGLDPRVSQGGARRGAGHGSVGCGAASAILGTRAGGRCLSILWVRGVARSEESS